MTNYKVDGLVLKARDFGEADRVLTIFDPALGKLEAVAKGVRRPKSSLRGPCQPFSHNLFFLWQGRTLDGISQCEVVESFAALREDLLRMAAASYVAELVDSVVGERDPNPDIFELTLEHFRWLEAAEATPATVSHVLRSFDLRFLGLAGFAPSLDACATCGAPAEEWSGPGSAAAFSAAAGGVVCPSCRAVSAADTPFQIVAAGTLASMRHLARATPEQARVLRLTPRAAKEMETALRGHILYHLDRRLKSLAFLDSVLG